MENEQYTDIDQDKIDQEVEDTDQETDEDSEVEGEDYKSQYEQLSMKYKKLKRKLFTKDTPKQPITTNSDVKWRERMELKVEGYDDQAIEFIQKNGGKKSLENPYISEAIKAMKEQKLAEKATLDEGSKSTTEKRFSEQEFAKLSTSEQIKVLSELK